MFQKPRVRPDDLEGNKNPRVRPDELEGNKKPRVIAGKQEENKNIVKPGVPEGNISRE